MYIGCFGSGLGHAARMLGVARLLRERGTEVRFSSSNEVASYIQMRGFECNRLPLSDVSYNAAGELAVGKTIVSSGVVMARALRQLTLELANLASFNPDAVISDSVLSTVVAAKMLGRRVITVLNQLLIDAMADRSTLRKVLSVGVSEGMSNMWGLSEMVMLPDLPPPYTISENNLWNASLHNFRYIGFLTLDDEGEPDNAYQVFRNDPRTRIFWQVSGPPMTRQPLLKKAFAIAEATSDRYTFVITGGDPRGPRIPVPLPGGWYYGWCTLAQHYFRSCDVVVSRAGHGTLAQAITSAKPSLLVPIPNQTEQAGNSAKAAKLGIALTVAQDELSQGSFTRAIDAMEGGAFAPSLGRASEVANKFEARLEIVRALSRKGA